MQAQLYDAGNGISAKKVSVWSWGERPMANSRLISKLS